MPRFDASGALVGLTIATQKTLFLKFQSLLRRGILDLEQAAGLSPPTRPQSTSCPAKGALEPGADADLTLLDAGLALTDVIARGRPLLRGGSSWPEARSPGRLIDFRREVSNGRRTRTLVDRAPRRPVPFGVAVLPLIAVACFWASATASIRSSPRCS